MNRESIIFIIYRVVKNDIIEAFKDFLGGVIIYEIYDITDWEMDYFSQASGTRNKYWVCAPEKLFNNKFLFKESKTMIGELWAEKVSAEIGTLLGLKMMHVQFAKLNNQLGVIMENFVPRGYDLQDGGSLLTKSIPNFNVISLDFYTIENIMNEITFFNMEKKFIEMCFFDFLIASSDRHCENWGLLHSKGSYQFAPIYDNGDSLGFNVPLHKLELYNRDIKAFEGFTNRSQTLIEVAGKRKPKTIKLLEYLRSNYHTIYNEVVESYSNLDYNLVLAILDKVPDEIMSDIYKEWVLRLIKHRHQILLHTL